MMLGSSQKGFAKRLSFLRRYIVDFVGLRSRLNLDIAPSKDFSGNRPVQFDVVDGFYRNDIIVFNEPPASLKYKALGVVLENDLGTVDDRFLVPEQNWQQGYANASRKRRNNCRPQNRIDPIKQAIGSGHTDIVHFVVHRKITGNGKSHLAVDSLLGQSVSTGAI